MVLSFACLTLCSGCLVRKRSFVHTDWTKNTSGMCLGDDTMGTFHVRSLRTRLTGNTPGCTSVDDLLRVFIRFKYYVMDRCDQMSRYGFEECSNGISKIQTALPLVWFGSRPDLYNNLQNTHVHVSALESSCCFFLTQKNRISYMHAYSTI